MNRSGRLRRVLLAGAATALLLTTATALAGSGVGGVFNLGQTNTVGATSILTGATAGPQLTVKNTSTNTSATALNLSVATGRTPMKVNSGVKVANLNADQLDGRDSTYFLPTTGTAANSSKLGGLLPGSFWKATGNAGTTPGTDFLGTSDNQALEFKVNGQRALRIEPDAAPNLIGGFSGNSVAPGIYGATIGGGGAAGADNSVTGEFGTVAGGNSNSAGGDYSTVAGGYANTASGFTSTVAGGYGNTASNEADTVAGGYGNTASGSSSTVAGGYANTASGGASTVPGGSGNTASGNYSFAAGLRAKATMNGSFVWGDSTDTDLTSPATKTFTVRASNGIWLGTNSSPTDPGASSHLIDTSTGAYLSSAGVWTDASDRALKHDFRPLDRHSVLEKVARMPITSWSFKAERSGIRHIGPMAQDFYRAFGLGLDDKHIGTIDEGGVALAAIQGLYRQNQGLRRENQSLKRENRNQDARLERVKRALGARLAKLERQLASR